MQEIGKQNENKSNRRIVGLDVLKTVCMFLIIFHHIALRDVNLRLLSDNTFDKSNIHFVFINDFFVVAVNCFFLISGYCGIKRNIKKILKQVIDIYIIFLITNLIFTAVGFQNLSFDLLKSCVFPISKYWFLLVYIVLELVAPYLNTLLDSLDRKEYNKLLVILLALYCGYAFLIDNAVFGANSGYSLVYAILLYIIGRYIRRFPIFNFRCIRLLMLFAVLCCVNGLVAVILTEINYGQIARQLFSYNNPLVLFASIFCFCFLGILRSMSPLFQQLLDILFIFMCFMQPL